MKKILCPVDSSMSSERVARYAAQLARDTESKVVLVATHQGKLATAMGGDDEDKGDAIELLGGMHDLLKMDYGIFCDIENQSISGNLPKKLGSLADHFDLTVLGAPKEKTKKEFENFAGIDLVKTIQASLAPLLIVPENFSYEKINRLTYAYDYTHEPQPPLAQLLWLASWFRADVRFVSILHDSTRNEERKFEELQSKIVRDWKPKTKISFESVAYKDVAECLDHYIGLWTENNLLLLSVNHRSIVEKIWHKSVVKELLRCAKRPYLILHK
jgi:hypothetical protein